MEGGGFEPPKAEPSDLQSDPFGHSGTPPRERSCVFSSSAMPLSTIITPECLIFRAPAMLKTRDKTAKKTPERLTPGSLNGAGTKSRTRDLLITSQLLYQLSYTGKKADMPAKTGAHSIGIGVPGAMWLNRNSGTPREHGNASSLRHRRLIRPPQRSGFNIRPFW